MELVIVICGLIAAGWAVWKTGSAIRKLRQQRRASGGERDSDDSAAGIGQFGGGSTSGDGFGSHHGGDCGHGHGGGDGGGHGGW